MHASAAADREEAEALLWAEQLMRQAEGRKAADSAAQAEAREASLEAKLKAAEEALEAAHAENKSLASHLEAVVESASKVQQKGV